MLLLSPIILRSSVSDARLAPIGVWTGSWVCDTWPVWLSSRMQSLATINLGATLYP